MKAATPRDLRVDRRGLGYLRGNNGGLMPYGHSVAAVPQLRQVPFAKPGGGGGDSSDTTPPTIAGMDPANGSEIGASHTFSAVVTDDAGVRSVTFEITYPDGSTTQSFNASQVANDVWTTTLQGFTDGDWSWQVVATDTAKRGGNTATSPSVSFSVNAGGGGGGGGGSGGDVVTGAAWQQGGAIQTAAGRIYFEMPANGKWKGPWNGYVCSGTVVTDSSMDRSIILTASHCIYDDANKAFARNVMFIPNQADTNGTGTDRDCDNDPLGCWVPSFGVVDTDWTTRTFPDNIPWDYGFFVVADAGAHQGAAASSDVLDLAAGSLQVTFDPPWVDDGVAGSASPDFTHALGYSYSDDPNFMYCAEDMTTEGADNWWLPSCGLTGGSSGGPWVQPMDAATGDGPVMSVNSWGYTNSPGMAGPKLSGTSAQCLMEVAEAQWVTGAPDGEAGIAADCP